MFGLGKPKAVDPDCVPVPPTDFKGALYGWLSPDGEFFKTRFGGHYGLATKLVEHKNIPSRDGRSKSERDPGRDLEALGWIHVSEGGYHRAIKPGETYYQNQYIEPTARQKDVIYVHTAANEYSLPEYMTEARKDVEKIGFSLND